MAPIKLKIKTNSKSFNPFTQLDTEDELSQTWRVCTKVKDSLENGSRYENLAWRLWFMHNVNAQSKKLPTSSTTTTTTTHSSRKEKAVETTNNENNSATFLQQQQQQQLEEHQEQLQFYDTQPHPVHKNIQQRRKVGKKATSSTVQKKQKQQQQYDQYQYHQQQQQQHVPPPQHQHQHQQEMAPQLVSSNTLPPDPHVATTTTGVPESSMQRQQMVPPSLAPCSVPDPMILPQQQQQQQDNQQTALMSDPSYYQDFVLPQFSSDQDINQTISLQDSDIFGDMLMHLDNNNWMNTVPLHTMNDSSTNNNNIIDPSSSSHAYTNNNNNLTTTATSDFWYNNNPMMMQPQPQQQQQNNNDLKNALYISEECIAPMPHQTLYNKILSIVPQDKLVSSVERVMEQQTPQLQLQLQQQLQQQQDTSQKPVMATPSEGKQAICSNCETTQTPLWRRSANDELLCNACGLYAKLHKAPRPRYFENSPTSSQDEGTRIVCSNCATTTTPLWRRDANGEPLCNACGLYLKLHHSKRPLSMKTDVIKKRQRTGDVGIPKGIRMINHQFNQSLSTTTTSTVSQEHSQEQQQFSPSSSSTNTNSGDINSSGFHNYTFQQVSSPQ